MPTPRCLMEGAAGPYAYALACMLLMTAAIVNTALPFVSGACLPNARYDRSPAINPSLTLGMTAAVQRLQVFVQELDGDDAFACG